MDNQIDFALGETEVKRWATPAEFSTPKKIAIVSFQRLSKDKGETTARFVDKEGKTYRLTFVDIVAENKVRTLEVHSAGFKRDLAYCVRKDFGTDSVPEGQPVMLRTYKEKVTYKNVGEREINRWELKKCDEKPIDLPKEIVEE